MCSAYKISLLMIMLLLLTIGCDNDPMQTAEQKSTEPTVAILLYKVKDGYLSVLVDYLEKGFPKQVKLLIQDGQGDQLTQGKQFATILRQGVDVVLLNPVEPQSSSRLADQAKKADIPVSFFQS